MLTSWKHPFLHIHLYAVYFEDAYFTELADFVGVYELMQLGEAMLPPYSTVMSIVDAQVVIEMDVGREVMKPRVAAHKGKALVLRCLGARQRLY